MSSFKITNLPTTEEVQRAAEQVQNDRRETAGSLLSAAHNLREAQQFLADREREYKDAWKDATKQAWSPTELTKQGFPNPIRSRARKSTT